ncbi:hypothetical protein ACJJTC_006909, partial [Scirpophaga incertulas]
TMATLGICLWNLRFTNNFMKVHSVLTIFSTLCVLAYRIATSTLNFPFADIATWDTVAIVSFFWASITAQFVIEILSYIGIFKWCGMNPTNQAKNQKFDYIKPKAKTEDYFYDSLVEEPWNLDDVKLNLARSISHLMLNNMMLTIILLMRPHNVIMVPSIFFTCVLTSKCLDHKLLDTKRGRNTDIADVLSLTLSHLWIGAVFFFYQGNSNSLASVDLGSGYVGLREYCPVRVAARMGLHAYAGPALAGGTLFCTLTRTDSWARYRQSVWRACNIFAFQRVYTLVIYSVIAIFFRHHLFVWSVFSPKLLYDFVGTVFTIQAINTILQIIVLTHVTSWIAKVLTYKSKL